MLRTLLLLLLVGVGQSVIAQEWLPAARFVELKFEIERDGRALGAPTVIAEMGVDGRVESGQADGAYRLQFRVGEPIVDEHGRSLVKVDARWFEPAHGKWKLVSAPTLVIELGAPMSRMAVAGEHDEMLGVAARIVPAAQLESEPAKSH